jgi:TolA-binding protein
MGNSNAPKDMTNASLLTFIQSNPLQKSMPHMLEVIDRIESDKDSGEELNGLLARCYYEVARHHYNRFVANPGKGGANQAIDYGKKLRKRFPSDINAPATLQFEINCYQLQKEWEDMRKSLELGLNGIAKGIYPKSYKAKWLEDICYSYASEKLWKEGRPRFIEAYDDMFSSYRLKNIAALYLIQSYTVTEEAEKVLPLIAHLQDAKEDRYDPNLNLSLFKLGNQFSEKGEFSSANYMYFLCLTIETIIEHNEQLLERKNIRSKWFRSKKIPVPDELTEEISDLKSYIAELKKQTSYTGPLKYYRARNLKRMDRIYDAYFAYLRLINEHPEHNSAELFHYTAFNQAIEIDYLEDALDLGERYIAKSHYKLYRRETLVKLVAAYFQLERYDRVHALGRIFVQEYPTHLYGNNVVHFMGFAWMRLGDIDQAREVLGGYLKAYPDAPMSQSAHYWVGLGDVIEQKFEDAINHFDIIIAKHKEGNFYVEARFRRAVCDFGLGDYDAAERRFNEWVADYPANHLRGEAEVFLGDIDAYYAKVETALAHYALTETFTQKMNLVDHAYFESVRLLDANSRYDDMIALLDQYMEKYQEEGNLSRAILQIGQAYESTGQPEVMIQSYYDAIVRFGNNPRAEGVDEIFKDFAGKYNKFITYYESTIGFIESLLNDEAFRLSMIDDRKTLHLHRMKHQEIDSDIIDSLLRNPELREGLGTRAIPLTEEEVLAGAVQQYDTSILPEAKANLKTQLAHFKELLGKMPSETPESQLRALFNTAKAEGQRTLELRLLAAFNRLGMTPPGDSKVSIQDLPDASPATLAWIGSEMLESDPTLSQLAIDRVLFDHPESLAVPDALETKAKIAYNAGDFSDAVSVLDTISDRYPTWPKAPEIALRSAGILLESKRTEDALARYLEILQIRDWRGTAWAEACYKIGRCYEATDDTLKAHGFYERTYLSYRQFPEWAGKAYYRDGILLENMNEAESAKAVYAAYLELPNAQQLDDYNDVLKRHAKL